MKNQILRYLMLVLALLIAAAIFLFSAENGEESGHLSDKIAEKILQIFGGADADASGVGHGDAVVSVGSVFRKIAHFIEYFALGAAFCGFFATFSISKLRCGIFSAGITILFPTRRISILFRDATLPYGMCFWTAPVFFAGFWRCLASSPGFGKKEKIRPIQKKGACPDKLLFSKAWMAPNFIRRLLFSPLGEIPFLRARLRELPFRRVSDKDRRR